jgi:hypothetical protein
MAPGLMGKPLAVQERPQRAPENASTKRASCCAGPPVATKTPAKRRRPAGGVQRRTHADRPVALGRGRQHGMRAQWLRQRQAIAQAARDAPAPGRIWQQVNTCPGILKMRLQRLCPPQIILAQRVQFLAQRLARQKAQRVLVAHEFFVE